MKNDSLKIILGYIFICLIWGSTWVAIRLGLDSLTPFISAGLRFTFAATLIFSILVFRKIKISLDSKSLILYLFMGILSFLIPFWLVYWAEQFIPSSLASVLFGAFPFSVFLFSLFMLESGSADKYKLLSVLLGFVGILIIFLDGIELNIGNHFIGLAAVLLSAIMQGFSAVVVKKWGGYLNPFSMNAPPLLIAGLVMIILAFIFEDSSLWDFNQKAILSISYLAVFGTILAFTTYYWLLQRINAVILSLSSFITPIIALILGWLILDEKLSNQVLFGTLFVLMGILFGNFNALRKSKLFNKRINNA